MRISSKLKKSSLLIAFLATLLSPVALASFYDEEDGDPGVIPDSNTNNDIINNINNNINAGGTGQVVIHDDNGDVNLVVNINNDTSQPPSNNTQIQSPPQSSTPVVTPDVIKKQIIATNSILTAITASPILRDTVQQPNVVGLGGSSGSPQVIVQLASPSAAPGVNQTKAAEVVTDLVKQARSSPATSNGTKSPLLTDAPVSKANALGTPAAFVVSQNAFTPGTNTLTPQASELFSSVKLNTNDVVTVVATDAKASAVVTELQKNGVAPEQIKVLPTTGGDPNTVAVDVVRLPMLADIFTP